MAPSRDPVERVLLGLEALLAVGAVGGAIGPVTGGIGLGSAKDDLPWRSLLFAGWAPLVVNGRFPAAATAAAWRTRWAPVGHVLVGAALVVSIVVQVAQIGPGLAPCLALGLLIAARP